MIITIPWLKEHLQTKANEAEIIDKLTNIGLEVEGIKESVGELAEFKVAKILKVEKHPNADKLKICDVNIKGDELLKIICGAPNVTDNILVPIATIGSKIGDFKIKKTKIRGIESNGMICSEKELGLSENHEGIMILDDNFQKGAQLKDFFPIEEDSVFDFDITPNRGDCFSHLGIARELSIIEGIKLKEEKVIFEKSEFHSSDLIDVSIKDNNACPRYACRIIKDIKVSDSPQWLKNKLALIGQKSINNVVDLANYIMFDLGQPLHTFDYDKLNGKKIKVRLAKNNEKIL